MKRNEVGEYERGVMDSANEGGSVSCDCREKILSLLEKKRTHPCGVVVMRMFIAACKDGSLLGKSAPLDLDKMKSDDPELHAEIMAALKEMERE